MRLSAFKAIIRSYVKDVYHCLARTQNLLRLRIPAGVILDRSVRVTNPERIEIKPGVSIGRGVELRCSRKGKISLGTGVVLAENVILATEDEGVIEVGDGTGIGPHVRMCTKTRIQIGAKNEIMAFASIESREHLHSGVLMTEEGVTIHSYNFLDTTGNITIGANTHTGPFCLFFTHNHNFKAAGSIWQQGIRVQDIKLGSGIWMGSKVVIMPGAVVGDDSVIGACSLVTHQWGQDEVLIGIPAKSIRKRFA